VTDNSWYRCLAARPEVTEVNFRQPSGAREFRILAPGEPFFFKTHYRHNKIGRRGFFVLGAPGQEAAQFGFGVIAGGALETGQVRSHCQLQLAVNGTGRSEGTEANSVTFIMTRHCG
jgi:putative restriction endonuclease